MTVNLTTDPLIGKQEYPFFQEDFDALAAFSRANFGIDLPDSKMSLVYSRLARRLRERDVPDFSSYRKLLNDPSEDAEREAVLSALTTNVTRFFREMHHFEFLRGDLLPTIIKQAKQGKRIRIWSAGCSTGQEALSIAMCILELCSDVATLDLRILATDIDPKIVDQASTAIYSSDEIATIPENLRRKYFTTGESDFGAVAELHDLITFRVFNLIQPLPFAGPFQAIFCRNVAIYFDKPTQQKVWCAFDQVLDTNGHLFIGHSERLSGAATNNLKPVGITTYAKN